jgi:GH24 family phage-related lysozyme (muramidase)
MPEKKRKHPSREIIVSRPRVNHAPPRARPIPYTILKNNALSIRVVIALILLFMVVAIGATYIVLGDKQIDPIAIPMSIPTSIPTAESIIQYVERTVIVIVSPTSLPPAKKVSVEGRKFISLEEGDSLIAYFDVGQHCTIGTGHQVDPVWCLGELKITADKAREWFDQDIVNTERHLAEKLGGVNLNQCQFDALASFHFNLGNYYFDNSGMIEVLQEGNFTAIPDVLGKFVYAEGKGPIKGMQIRRAAEAKLFSECQYEGS